MAAFKLSLFVAIAAVGLPKGYATCATEDSCNDNSDPLALKIIAIVTILISSMIGVTAPFFTRSIKALHPEGNLFLVVKTFASGIILATGFMHVLPDSFAMLSNSCLNSNPWHLFPFSGFLAMISAILTMMIDSMATSFYSQKSGAVVDAFNEQQIADPEVNKEGNFHGHHNSHNPATGATQLIRYRVIAMVLELGIVVHSVVIGLSLGASNNVCTIKGLIAALCFHQMFEGMGLGGSILQANFMLLKKAIMAFFFSVTTPFGIALGIALSKVYRPDTPKSLIIEGLLNACSAGLLIYMALVNLLAVEFMGNRLQNNRVLFFLCSAAVMVGAGIMSLLAKWA